VKPGERVITSGGDQIYPRGLPVGVVDEVVPDTSNPPYVDIILKPAANLGHLEELLVITQASDHMPDKEKQDLAQSAAEGAAVSQQRASDVLAERLPGLNDPTALAETGPSQEKVQLNPDSPTAPRLHPPPAVHADHFSPESMQPAKVLTPGQTVVDPKYAATEVSPGAGPAASKAGADGSAKAVKHSGAVAGTAAPSEDGSAGTEKPAKPKAPKAPPAEKPAVVAPEAAPGTEQPAAPASGPPPQ